MAIWGVGFGCWIGLGGGLFAASLVLLVERDIELTTLCFGFDRRTTGGVFCDARELYSKALTLEFLKFRGNFRLFVR